MENDKKYKMAAVCLKIVYIDKKKRKPKLKKIGHFFSGQDHFCSGWDNIKVAVITSSVVKITFEKWLERM